MDHLDDDDNGGTEDWLISYADMMTLIACFFILMMAFANYDPVGFNIKAEELSKHFRKDKYKSSETKFKEITEEIARHELKDRSKVSLKDGELVISFSNSVMFENGSASIDKELGKTLDSLIDVMKVANNNYRVLIEGHADDELKNSKYDSQWALSGARAAEVAKRFEYFGFPKDRIVPIGRGDSTPLIEKNEETAENSDEIKKRNKMNRRVVVRLLEPREKKKVKFGLGIYFKDATENAREAAVDETHSKEFNVE